MSCALKDQCICRICMQDDVVLDWNEELFQYCGMTFKDCYYKYSQLAVVDPDPFPQYVCEACSMDLQNFHLFMEKAVETQKFLEQNYNCAVNEILQSDEESKPVTECIYLVHNTCDSESVEPIADSKPNEIITVKSYQRRGARKKIPSKKVVDELESDDDLKLEVYMESDEDMYVPPQSSLQKEEPAHLNTNMLKGRGRGKRVGRIRGTVNVKLKKKTPVKCSYCSKVVHNAYYLKKHEQTHREDRPREVVCQICGLRFFTKYALREHMMTHDKNREKKFKCEFCDKAFFNRGDCNIHRRIHLGQMVKCPICPKEFYREADLARHIPSHSNDTLPSNQSELISKYLVHCKECNKQVRSYAFKAHQAAHRNEPLLRCIVCKKDFFSRSTCTKHMFKVHKRSGGNYEDIVEYYEQNKKDMAAKN